MTVCAILFVQWGYLNAQVINNNGAKISVNNAVVTGKDVQNSGDIKNNGEINLTGDWNNNGTMNSDAGKNSFTGSSDQAIAKTGGETFFDFVLNNSGLPAHTVNANCVLTINGTADFTKGQLNTTNDINFNGHVNCGAGTINATGGTATYHQSATHVISGTYYNLTLKGPSVKTLCGDVVVLGNLTIENGTLEVGSYSITVKGLTSISGTLSDNNAAGTNLFEGSVTINSGGSWNFSGNSNVELRNGLTHNGTSFNSGTGQYFFSTNAQTIDGSSEITLKGNVLIGSGVQLTNKNTSNGTGTTIQGTLKGVNAISIYRNEGITSYENSAEPMNTDKLDATFAGNIFRYSGAAQTIAAGSNGTYHHLVITGSNNKTFNGDVTVNGDLTVQNSTTIAYGSSSVYTLDVKGNLTAASGSIDMTAGSNINHVLTLEGLNNTCNQLLADDQSIIKYLGADRQQVFASTNYRNIVIGGTGTKVMQGNVTAAGNTFTLSANLDASSFVLYLSNPSASIVRTAGAVIGNMKRNLNATSTDYSYPVGAATSYNPLTIKFSTLTQGDYQVKYIAGDIGSNAGLPVNDDNVEVYDHNTTGYWVTQALNALTSSSYSVTLNTTGFGIDASSRILKWENGTLFVNGSHGGITGSDILRTGLNSISTTNTTFVIGKGHPRIVTPPSAAIVCEGYNTPFSITASGEGTLTYQWQVNSGGGFTNISNTGIYSNADKPTLNITGAPLTIDSYLYRCMVTDAEGHSNPSPPAKVTVNPTPVISFTQTGDTICDRTNAIIAPSATVTGSSYAWTVVSDAGVTGASNGTGYSINQLLTNSNNFASNVIYTVKPISTKGCVGSSADYKIWVEPTPKVGIIVEDTICNQEPIHFAITSPSNVTGKIVYDLVTTPDASISGYKSTSQNNTIADFNNTLNNSNVNVKKVSYVFTPKIIYANNSGYCRNGRDTSIIVNVNPTPLINLSVNRDSICFTEGSTIKVSSPNTSVIGKVRYNLAATYNTAAVTGVASNGKYDIIDLSQTSLKNNSDNIETVQYILTPFIENSRKGYDCNNGIADTITLTVMPEIKYSFAAKQYIGGYNIKCNGESNGLARIINLHGGLQSQGYSYLWNTGSKVDSIYNVKAGTYSTMVTDRLGCQTGKSITLTQPDVLGALDSIKNIECQGYSSGRIKITPTGGVPSYQYTWTGSTIPVTHTSILNNLIAGVYTLQIVDTNKCVYVHNYSIDQRQDKKWIAGQSTYGPYPNNYNISCKGMADGYFHPTIYTDTTIVNYQWTGPGGFLAGTQDINGLKPGPYSLKIVDAKGCVFTFPTKTLTEPDSIKFSSSVFAYPNGYNVQCANDLNGKITISNPTGGYGNYRYIWTTADGSGLLPGAASQSTLTAGTYSLTVKDTLCSASKTYTLTQANKLQVNANIPAYNGYEVSCNQGSNGAINLNVSGGYGEYSYLWQTSNGKGLATTSKDQSGLSIGDYKLTVTYGGVCSVNYQYSLKSPTAITFDSIKSVKNGGYNISCHGDNDGYINIYSVKGGLPNYSYNWTSPNGKGLIPANPAQNGLTAGTYTIDITDQNLCKVSKTIVLTQPDTLKIALNIKPISCSSGSDGSITANISGGTPGYNYRWSNGAQTSSISGIPSNRYSVTVTDKNNCIAFASDTITASDPLNVTPVIISNYNGQDISCYGAKDGKVRVNAAGGKPPYRYEWSNKDTTHILINADASTYQIKVYDSYGCSGNSKVTLTQPQPVALTFTKQDVLCHSFATGRITTYSSGGTTPYTYIWSNGETTPSINNIQAGNYSVTLWDVNNCHVSQKIEITQPDTIIVKNTYVEPYCPDARDGSISLSIDGGAGPYQIVWNTSAITTNLQNLGPARFIYKITDFNQCQLIDTFLLKPHSPLCLFIPSAFSPNNDGVNDTWEITAGDPSSPVQMKELYPNATVEVYNRWGILLYRSQPGYTNPWDGTYRGLPQPLDSYYYIIDPKNDRPPLKGIITIIK
ncbi:MAG: gliding motility-associated C-terminal domain-containing protein [Bacteroidota bacterium]|nr:gliding motility-associated C-terminal domain-containing protein [Bacteroidota bacterium]